MKFEVKNINAIGKPFQTVINEKNQIEPVYLLIRLGEVQESGAPIYFRPANNDFTCNKKTFFKTYAEAYESENW